MKTLPLLVAIVTTLSSAAIHAQQTLATYTASALGSRFGTSVALMPDVNGDGKADLLVGCPFTDTSFNGEDCSSVRVYSGLSGALIRVHYGAASGDQFG